MPAAQRQVTREDIIPDAEFRLQRKDRRAALLPRKALRRIALGPWCTFYFECFETMLFQIQEMLLIEKGGDAQIADELEAYNPLIPQGNMLIATLMFEVDDPAQRARVLAGLGRIEHHFEIRVGAERVPGVPESDAERSRDDGKTSAVHFIRFTFTEAQARAFRESAEPVTIACDDPRYLHMAGIGPETRAELARDL